METIKLQVNFFSASDIIGAPQIILARSQVIMPDLETPYSRASTPNTSHSASGGWMQFYLRSQGWKQSWTASQICTSNSLKKRQDRPVHDFPQGTRIVSLVLAN
ncbi:hypothetical protein EDB19DRAFT_1916657 [Suillus lakei]|nr:hypothetical protein EDB19DRAFT_1916657 [Suillus lakei]